MKNALIVLATLSLTLSVNSEINKQPPLGVKTLDLNNDKAEDIVIYSEPNMGDVLLFYINKNGNYDLKLESTNFSSDGGWYFGGIYESKFSDDSLLISILPSTGDAKIKYYLKYTDDGWFLTKTNLSYHKNIESTPFFSCTIIQDNIPLSSLPHRSYELFPAREEVNQWSDVIDFPENIEIKNDQCIENNLKMRVVENKAKLYFSPDKSQESNMYLVKNDRVNVIDTYSDTDEKWSYVYFQGKSPIYLWVKSNSIK